MRVGGHGSFIDNIVLFIFFEKGNPHPGGPGLKLLTFGTILALFFTFGKRILRFFLGLIIFGFIGAPTLFLCAGPRSLVMCFQVLPLFMLCIPPIPTG